MNRTPAAFPSERGMSFAGIPERCQDFTPIQGATSAQGYDQALAYGQGCLCRRFRIETRRHDL